MGSGYGFPSSHSQWMGYFGAFLLCHFTFRHRFVSLGSQLLDWLVKVVLNVRAQRRLNGAHPSVLSLFRISVPLPLATIPPIHHGRAWFWNAKYDSELMSRSEVTFLITNAVFKNAGSDVVAIVRVVVSSTSTHVQIGLSTALSQKLRFNT